MVNLPLFPLFWSNNSDAGTVTGSIMDFNEAASDEELGPHRGLLGYPEHNNNTMGLSHHDSDPHNLRSAGELTVVFVLYLLFLFPPRSDWHPLDTTRASSYLVFCFADVPLHSYLYCRHALPHSHHACTYQPPNASAAITGFLWHRGTQRDQVVGRRCNRWRTRWWVSICYVTFKEKYLLCHVHGIIKRAIGGH